MSDEIFWGPWVEHDQRGCPVSIGTHIQAQTDGFMGLRLREGVIGKRDIESPCWLMTDRLGDWRIVLRYRVRRNPSTAAAVEALKAMAMNPERVREGAINEVTLHRAGSVRSNPRFVENER